MGFLSLPVFTSLLSWSCASREFHVKVGHGNQGGLAVHMPLEVQHVEFLHWTLSFSFDRISDVQESGTRAKNPHTLCPDPSHTVTVFLFLDVCTHTRTQFFPQPFENLRHHAPSPLNNQCEFLKNKDILLYNHTAGIKIGKLALIILWLSHVQTVFRFCLLS